MILDCRGVFLELKGCLAKKFIPTSSATDDLIKNAYIVIVRYLEVVSYHQFDKNGGSMIWSKEFELCTPWCLHLESLLLLEE